MQQVFLQEVELEATYFSRFFTFNKKDWEKLSRKGKVSHAFIAHEPRTKLPENVISYINFGEKSLRTRVGKTCNMSMSSQSREKSKDFFGWYDLGEILHSPIYVPYYAQYMHRFTLANMPIVLDADFISFIPKSKTETLELKALLAYLNSNFNRFYIETHGRATGGGMLSIEVNQASKMPIINIKRLKKRQLKRLASLFDKLEEETRRIEGADSIDHLEKLQSIFDEIDIAISEFLGIKKELVKRIQNVVKILSERRISRTHKARPGTVKGEEEPKIRPPKKRGRRRKEEFHRPLTRWME